MSTAVIVGATGAIGRATARALASLGTGVVLLGRDERHLRTIAGQCAILDGAAASTVIVDLGDPDAVRRAADRVLQLVPSVDVVVHAAAIYASERRLVGPHWESMLAVNHLAPFLLTTSLLPALRTSRGRVLTLAAPATNALDLDDLQGERCRPLTQFGRTKVMNLLFAAELARREPDVLSVAVHPGLVRSSLMKEAIFPMRWLSWLVSSPPEAAATGIASLATSEPADVRKTNGGLWHAGKQQPVDVPAVARDEGVTRNLWERTEALVNAREGYSPSNT